MDRLISYMKKYITKTELYLTFLTRQDSYMEKVPAGTILTLVNGDLCYNGKISIDNQIGFLHHGYIAEYPETLSDVTSG